MSEENVQATTYEGELKVFTWDSEEWVVARDPADAMAVFVEMCGPTDEPTEKDWTECPAAKTIAWDDQEDDGGPAKRFTFAELAKRGRGYLGSANY